MKPPPACLLVLNYNGRDLLDECLPSVLQAGQAAQCPTVLVDNSSTDGSVEHVRGRWPEIEVVREPNRGLASFNAVVERRQEPVALLLNSDVRLGPGAVLPLVAALKKTPEAMFAAPLCWGFDGQTYEGMRTRVRWRRGLPQGTSRAPGHLEAAGLEDWTAAAGPVLAVDRDKFLALGGFDPLYFPGRIEDLDLGLRAWMAGWHGAYVPESVAWHKGLGSFGPAFGEGGCDRLAARNTWLFCWKNLEGARLFENLAWLPPRMALAALRGRWGHFPALGGALLRLPEALAARRRERSGAGGGRGRSARQDAFFRRFAW